MFNNEINYKSEGRGKTIVLIHGLSDNLEYWEAVSTYLKNEYNIIRYDLRGHGKSPLGEDEITIELFVKDLNDLLTKLNVDECTLIGFSLGGVIASEYALKYPSKVSSLILMSSFSNCSQPMKEIFLKLKDAVKSSFEEFYDLILPMVLCPNIITENQNELEIIKRQQAPLANRKAIEKSIDAMLNFNNTNNLIKINTPTLIICGKYDELTPKNIQEQMHKNIKNSEMIIIDNVKHNLLIGNNVIKIREIIENFIEK